MAKKLKKDAPEGILPTTDFRDTPFPGGDEVSFKAGIMSSPVPHEFAERMRKEGKAAPKAKVATPKPNDTDKA